MKTNCTFPSRCHYSFLNKQEYMIKLYSRMVLNREHVERVIAGEHNAMVCHVIGPKGKTLNCGLCVELLKLYSHLIQWKGGSPEGSPGACADEVSELKLWTCHSSTSPVHHGSEGTDPRHPMKNPEYDNVQVGDLQRRPEAGSQRPGDEKLHGSLLNLRP